MGKNPTIKRGLGIALNRSIRLVADSCNFNGFTFKRNKVDVETDLDSDSSCTALSLKKLQLCYLCATANTF